MSGPACSSPVFCQGELLEAVQTLEIFVDDKTFVDMTLKEDADVIMRKFHELKGNGTVIDTEKLRDFIDHYMLPVGEEMIISHPVDWHNNPAVVQKIKSSYYQEWAKELNELWKTLCRKTNSEARVHLDRHTQLFLPNAFIVPGDRFREFYYWDTYWIVSGLLASDMVETSKSVIKNLVHLVSRFGFVPNGGRTYYLNRSQPPLLIPTIDSYLNKTKDVTFAREVFPLMEREYSFWTTERSITVRPPGGSTHNMTRYYTSLTEPRPEGYRPDLHATENVPEAQKPEVYRNIVAACESGWDFTARWFEWEGPNEMKLTSIKTTKIIPVDLNSYMLWAEKILARTAALLGDHDKAAIYRAKADRRWRSIQALLWNEEDGVWYDYDTENHSQRRRFFTSNITPLLIMTYDGVTEESKRIGRRVTEYLEREGVLEYPGGIPNSLERGTGQQWDFPNVWAPSISHIVQALRNSGDEKAGQVSKQVANTWLESTYIGWRKYKKMFEKYDVRSKGAYGGDGEYEVQVGFGWTNGVALELLDLYPDLELMEMTLYDAGVTSGASSSF